MYQLSSASPESPIVSVEALYEHLRIADTSEAAYLHALSLAAEAFLEKATGIGLQPLRRLYIIDTHDVSDGGFQIVPYGPVVMPTEDDGKVLNPITLTAVAVDGAQTQLDITTGPLLQSKLAMTDCIGPAAFWLLSCTAGCESAPEMAKQAIKLIVGAWYERREAVDSLTFNEVPFGARALINLLADPASRF